LFQGLDVPPPVEDITLTIFGEQPGDETIYSGDEINFAQNLRGTDGDDQFDLTDVYSDYEVYVGEGDDDVTFNALRGRVYLEEGDDTYQSTARADAGTVPSETVLGGAGNDVILGGNGIVMSYGGLGDDTLGVARSDELDAAEVMLNGGAGADALTFSENATVTGGDGADAFTFLPMLGEAAAPSILTDFDPDEDALLIQLDPLYVGAGIATLAPNGDGTLLQIDGQTALMLTQPVSDLSSIVVLQ
jgi:Ca2+-binding RTX toxin-like protein